MNFFVVNCMACLAATRQANGGRQECSQGAAMAVRLTERGAAFWAAMRAARRRAEPRIAPRRGSAARGVESLRCRFPFCRGAPLLLAALNAEIRLASILRVSVRRMDCGVPVVTCRVHAHDNALMRLSDKVNYITTLNHMAVIALHGTASRPDRSTSHTSSTTRRDNADLADPRRSARGSAPRTAPLSRRLPVASASVRL